MEAISNPAAKKAVNTRPMMASSRKRVRCLTSAIPSAASSPENERAGGVRQLQQVGTCNARHYRVTQGVAHQRPTLEHQVGGQESANGANQGADEHRLQHVVVEEGREEFAHDLSPLFLRRSGSSSRRSP